MYTLRDRARAYGEEVLRSLVDIANTGSSAAARAAARSLERRGLAMLLWVGPNEDWIEFLGRVARGEKIAGITPMAVDRITARKWIDNLKDARRLRALLLPHQNS